VKIVEFDEQDVVYAKDQPEYLPLPAHKFDNADGQGRIACCWKMTIKERIKVLFTGIIWHEVLTFNAPLQPQLLSVNKPLMKPKKTQ
jgi:hypothetical protein